MKYFTFKRETNNFDDILQDANLKKWISTKLYWNEHLMLGLTYTAPESVYGYIVLKYGECLTNPLDRDYTPIPGRDYIPKRH